MEQAGIDRPKSQSQICIFTGGGELIEKGIQTDRNRFAEVLGPHPESRILLEASTKSEGVARCLEGPGHDVIVGDPNFAPMYAERSRKGKTDRRDARALVEACLEIAVPGRSSAKGGPPRRGTAGRGRCWWKPPGPSSCEPRTPSLAPLRTWAERLAARRGRRVAVVALARKLAGILYAMMRDGTEFDGERWKGSCPSR